LRSLLELTPDPLRYSYWENSHFWFLINTFSGLRH
jgi:hypothetical protein